MICHFDENCFKDWSQCKDHLIKNEGNRVLTTLYRSMAPSSVVGDGIWQKFKLISAYMVVLVTYMYEEDPSKMKVPKEIDSY